MVDAISETPATAGKPAPEAFPHPKVLVTARELKIALGQQAPEPVKEGAKAKPEPVLDFLKAGKGIVAKEYEKNATGKLVPNGKVRTGKKALEYVMKGFGTGRYRGLYADESKAKPEVAKAAIEVSGGREMSLQIRQREGKKAEAKKEGGREV